MSPSRSRRRKPRKKKNNNTKLIIIVALLAVVVLIAVGYVMLGNNSSNENVPIKSTVLLKTSRGNIVIKLRDDMSITTTNFKELVQRGVYDGTLFHRVVNIPQSLVMIQGGDPSTGTWSGGPISNIPDEFSENSENNKEQSSNDSNGKCGSKHRKQPVLH